ncbi:MAG: hypothetical protein AAF492_16280, partial [Verrucomicrobiota bacterium]
TFARLSSGSEFEFGEVRISILAPSIDLRNRFDTFGIGKNDASIVMKVQYRDAFIILAGDAEFASWGKITEEFPRTSLINFSGDALELSERDESTEQLNCQVLKVSHHGSKHGSTLEYLERLTPGHVVIPAGSASWYGKHIKKWKNKFPHPLTTHILEVLNRRMKSYITGRDGHLLFGFTGSNRSRVQTLKKDPGTDGFRTALKTTWKKI